MKKIVAMFAAALLSTTAMAADFSAGTNSLSLGFGPEQTAHGGVTSWKGSMNLVHGLTDNIGIGLQNEIYQTQDSSHDVSNNVEADVWYQRKIMGPVSGKVGLGVGEHISDSHNFPFYAAYVQGDVALGNGFTLNAVQYRYRNAFDTRREFESHTVGTGVTYDLNDTSSVSGKVFRKWDGKGTYTSDGMVVAYNIKF
jgi:uncharacterized protein YdeI (BOF family)